MGLKIFLKNKLVDANEAKVSVFDHGVLYGDGVFEGIRSYNRRVFKLKEHMDRLYESADAIRLEIPISKEEFTKFEMAMSQLFVKYDVAVYFYNQGLIDDYAIGPYNKFILALFQSPGIAQWWENEQYYYRRKDRAGNHIWLL